ncbi:MAG TPA: type II secretion system F family protein [Alphaproteobacteria bacterium]|nr:type II secretion system F family protein [Alphaproteobacteria bacterium]
MSLAYSIASRKPELKEKLRSAGIRKKPAEFIDESLKNGFMMAMMITIMGTFIILKNGIPIIMTVFLFGISFGLFYTIMLKRLDVAISKREKEIDRDVLFAGRFLLVKLNSGKPLINALFEASESYGVAGEYFKEIVEDIKIGTPLEDSLEKAYRTTPSKKFKKILFQINNALKIGVDVSQPLESILEEISHEQLIEIQRYGKKLSSIIMFYLLAAIVVPSLGITLFSIVASMMSLKIDMAAFLMILFFLMVIQLMFIGIIKGIRPNLNI